MSELIREVVMRPASETVGCVLAFRLKGAEGVVQFMIDTRWHLLHVNDIPHMAHEPFAVDLGCHSHTPRYEGEEPLMEDCPLLDGPCYYTGSGLLAQELFQRMVVLGSDAVWQELEKRYAEWLCGTPQ